VTLVAGLTRFERLNAREKDARPLARPSCHLAQVIGITAIQQDYKVLHRESHMLEELADAALGGSRKQYIEMISTVPLLVIDDSGMRKLPATAGEDLLEIVMRCYEHSSTLLTLKSARRRLGQAVGRQRRGPFHARPSPAPWARPQMRSAELAHQDRGR
jgi:hypothetical protein